MPVYNIDRKGLDTVNHRNRALVRIRSGANIGLSIWFYIVQKAFIRVFMLC